MVRDIAYLKAKFETGDVPTQEDFHDWLDTMFSFIGGSDFDPENILTNLKFANTSSNRILERRRFSGSILQYLSQIIFGDNDLQLIVEDWATGGVLKSYATYRIIGASLHNWTIGNIQTGETNSMQLFTGYLNLNKPARYSSPLSLVDDLDLVYKKWVEDRFLLASAYNDRYKGRYTSLVALQTAHPTSTQGSYAQVDSGAGNNVVNYNWDVEDGWVIGSSGSSATDTDMLPEGSVNLYFTNARAIAALSGTLSSYLLLSDIINVLTDTSTNKALSAAQGKLLKDTADALATTVASKANDSSVVHLAGSETLTGKKTFSAGLKIPASQSIQGASDIAVIEPVNASGSDTSFWRFTSGIATIIASAQGTLSNIGKTFQTKGTGVFSFVTNSLERLKIAGDGLVTISNLAGTGDRVQTVDSTGLLKANHTLKYARIFNQIALNTDAGNSSAEKVLFNTTGFGDWNIPTARLFVGRELFAKSIGTIYKDGASTADLIIRVRYGLASDAITARDELYKFTYASGAWVAGAYDLEFTSKVLSLGVSGVILTTAKFQGILMSDDSFGRYTQKIVNTTTDKLLTITYQFSSAFAGNKIESQTASIDMI